MKEKIYNTLYGAIVADALGVPVEFKDREYLKKNPVTDMIGYGTYNLPKGSWSDDSSMMLCLAESIGCQKGIDYEDIMHNFFLWLKHAKFTPDHHVFDVGRTCQTAIEKYCMHIKPLDCGLSDERSNGNGSLMRIAPLPLFLFQKFGEEALRNEEAFSIIHNVSRLTHAHAISLIGCDIYCSIMIEILKGTRKDRILLYALPAIGEYVRHHPDYEKALAKYDRITHRDFVELPENEIKSSGYVVDTLEAALWCFLTTDNYQDCVLKAVNLGFDTDTVACIAGSIAGLYYGNIPEKWISTIRNKRLINKILDKFSNYLEYELTTDEVLINTIRRKIHETDYPGTDLNNGLYPIIENNITAIYYPVQCCVLVNNEKIIRHIHSYKEAEKLISKIEINTDFESSLRRSTYHD